MSCVVMCLLTTSIWSRAPRTVPRFTSSCTEVCMLCSCWRRPKGGQQAEGTAASVARYLHVTLGGWASVCSLCPGHTLPVLAGFYDTM